MKPLVTTHFLHLSRSTVLVLALLLCCLRAQAQGDMLVITTAGSSTIVCGAPVTFTVSIQNTAGTLLEDIRLDPGLVTGLRYVPGSATNMAEIAPLSPDAPRFFLPNIDAGNLLTATFQVQADCRLVDYIRSNFGQNPALATPLRNTTRITYNKAGVTDLVFNEPNGSESYNVAYADLDISVNAADINKSGNKPGETFERGLSVRNSGLGSVSQLSFFITMPENLQLLRLKIVTGAGATLRVANQALVTNGTYRFDIQDFSGVGDGDGLLEQNETIFLKDSVAALACGASLETRYAATWGCEGTVCNEGTLQAVTNAYINIPPGNATLTSSMSIANAPEVSWCPGTQPTVNFVLTNTGATASPLLQGAYDVEFNLVTDIRMARLQNIYLANGTDITSLITSRNTQGNLEYITLNFGSFLNTDPGPRPGLPTLTMMDTLTTWHPETQLQYR